MQSTNGGLELDDDLFHGGARVPVALGGPADHPGLLERQRHLRLDDRFPQRGDTLVVGGVDQGGGTDEVLELTYQGPNPLLLWNVGTDITKDINGNGPHADILSMTLDANNDIVVGTDGGIWRAVVNYAAQTAVWTNLNGDLDITQMTGVATQPIGGTGIILGAAGKGDGVFQYTGDQSWTEVLDPPPGGSELTAASHVIFDPTNPQVAYAEVESFIGTDIYKSTNGGTTWTMITNIPFPAGPSTPLPFGSSNIPLVIDPLNDQRLLLGGVFPATTLEESLNGGVSWTNLLPGLPPFSPVTDIALAEYQGAFVADPAFTSVGDVGTNTDVPNTMYVTDGTKLYVTKDHGVDWTSTGALAGVSRTPPLTPGTKIQDIEVDPADSNVVFVVTSGITTSGGRVFESTNSGQSWTDISTGLPLVVANGTVSPGWNVLPAWKLAIDSRTGDLYLGTDDGVWKMTGGAGSWVRFGAGLPNVQVTGLDLNTTTNILTIATYGRGAWQFYLDDNTLPTAPTNPGALRAVSGNDSWNGPVTLAGPTTISADGSQALQSTQSGASLTILGTISDSSSTTANTLTKTGGGNVILGGDNTYAGLTDVRQGNLIAQNAGNIPGVNGALGAGGGAGLGTTVEFGAALELSSSVFDEAVTLNGNGILPPYNGHYTGALVNVSNFNTFTGTITLNTNASIGVQAGQLTIASVNAFGIVDGGTPTTAYALDKEGVGPLVLASPDSYQGGTTVSAGIVNVQNSTALGAASTTTVSDGAQVQLDQTGATALVVANQTLSLTGDGVNNDGALRNVAGNNTWAGGIVLTTTPQFSPSASPQGVVAFYVAPSTTLTLSGSISEGAPPQPTGLPATNPPASGLAQIGGGTLVLAGVNTYTGGTYAGYTFGVANTSGANAPTVPGGIIDVQNSGALGLDQGNEIQRIFTYDPPASAGDTFNLSFNGSTTTTALPYGAPAGSVQTALDNLASIGAGGVTVSATTVYTGLDEVQTLNLANPVSPLGAPVQALPTLAAGGTIPNNTTYFYVITAITAGSETVPSNEQTITTVTANQEINLSWNAVAGASGYKVYRATISGNYSSPALLTTITSGAITTFTDTGAAVGVGTPPVQTTFNLTFDGHTTATPIAYTGVAATDAAAIAAALNTVPILGLGGSVTVTADATDTLFTITFGGTLSDAPQSLIVPAIVESNATATVTESTPGDGGPAYIYTVAFTGTAFHGVAQPLITVPTITNAIITGASEVATGGIGTLIYQGSVLQLDGDPGESGASITLPAADTLAISGTGPSGAGAFVNVTGNNNWQGNVILQANATVAAAPTTQLTISGLVQDPTPPTTNIVPTTAPPDLTKAGSGTVILAPDRQTITLTGAVSPLGTPVQNAPALLLGGAIPLGTTYYYVVTALGANGETMPSNEQTVTTTAANQEVVVSWTAVAGATGYKIYRSTTSGSYASPSLLTTISSGATTSFIDVGTATTVGTPPVQTMFTLTFGGVTTPAIPYSGVPLTDAAAIATKLTALATIGGAGGTAVVTADPTDTIFTVILSGLGALNVAPITGVITASPTTSIGFSTNTYTGNTFVAAGDLNIQSGVQGSFGYNTSSVQEVSVSGTSGSCSR